MHETDAKDWVTLTFSDNRNGDKGLRQKGDSGDSAQAPFARENEGEEKLYRDRRPSESPESQSHPSSDVAPPPVRRYATCESDNKPTYHLDEPALPFSDHPRIAALDVMILMFAARRHAEWLAELGECPSDVAELVQGHLNAVAEYLGLRPPTTPDVGPRSQPATGSAGGTGALFGATDANVCNERRTRW